ncbi:FAD-binding oxidoreductase [Arthrobacter sp. Cr_A7]|uniref:FAD-binding oxidoreductase n=1 Tax=Arthrobacter sp. Cr_A7 TaxID=3031017 RepID=UPI0023DC5E87|nr:FAD-binding oxidoreductase [Arthrobacter sp. Cr_A7]
MGSTTRNNIQEQPDSSAARGLEGLDGEVLWPGADGFDEARSIENGRFDRCPTAIVCCASNDDVVAAISFAREHDLEIAIKGGGHHVAGLAVCEGGLMLDMSRLKTIDIDLEARVVRAGTGLTWGELIGATQAHGLATASGTTATVGIAGLTLGGGLGLMMAKHGYAADNLLAARVVTADGRVLTASEDEHRDLFWALRGGGGNFGVVTELTFRLHPIGPVVTGVMVAHPIEDAADVLHFYREFTDSGLSDDLVIAVMLCHLPDGSGARVLFTGVHFGSEEDALRELEPMRTFGSPVSVSIGPTPYITLLNPPEAEDTKGRGASLKSSFLRELSDEAIQAITRSFAASPSPWCSVLLEHFHGALTRVPVDATPIPYRKAGHNLLAFAFWPDLDTSGEHMAWTDQTYETLWPFFDDYVFPNYVDGALLEDKATARRAYGPNLERLMRIKTTYDPENIFHLNLNFAHTATEAEHIPKTH